MSQASKKLNMDTMTKDMSSKNELKRGMTAEGIKGRLQQQLQTSSKKDGRGGRRREGAEEEL